LFLSYSVSTSHRRQVILPMTLPLRHYHEVLPRSFHGFANPASYASLSPSSTPRFLVLFITSLSQSFVNHVFLLHLISHIQHLLMPGFLPLFPPLSLSPSCLVWHRLSQGLFVAALLLPLPGRFLFFFFRVKASFPFWFIPLFPCSCDEDSFDFCSRADFFSLLLPVCKKRCGRALLPLFLPCRAQQVHPFDSSLQQFMLSSTVIP